GLGSMMCWSPAIEIASAPGSSVVLIDSVQPPGMSHDGLPTRSHSCGCAWAGEAPPVAMRNTAVAGAAAPLDQRRSRACGELPRSAGTRDRVIVPPCGEARCPCPYCVEGHPLDLDRIAQGSTRRCNPGRRKGEGRTADTPTPRQRGVHLPAAVSGPPD